jgi:hypothetical protein
MSDGEDFALWEQEQASEVLRAHGEAWAALDELRRVDAALARLDRVTWDAPGRSLVNDWHAARARAEEAREVMEAYRWAGFGDPLS